ncbi:MAG: lysostaphin resistance A-like protein, partial [Flavobacteriales bacterium]
MKPSSHLNVLAGDTLFAMPILGAIILGFFNDVSLADRWTGEFPWFQQLLLGLVIGIASAWLAETVLNLKKLNNVMEKYSGILGGFDLSKKEMAWLSICAGVGEELLFRGVLQWVAIEYLGLWLGIGVTSILFIAIHGYLNPKNGNIFLYGFFFFIHTKFCRNF